MQSRKPRSLPLLCAALLGCSLVVCAQDAPQVSAPVSYASLSQLNTMLSQLEQTSQNAQLDIAKLRIDKWKADGATRRQMQSNADSVQRNLHDALPEIINQLRASPEDLATTFKLYRNLSALYDVFSSIVESAGAFGSKDDFQALDNDLSALDQSRRSLGDRMDDLSTAKDAEIKHLRSSLQAAQASLAAQKQPKVIVNDEEPAKKTKPPVKKSTKTNSSKSTTKTPPKPATNPNSSSTPSATPHN